MTKEFPRSSAPKIAYGFKYKAEISKKYPYLEKDKMSFFPSQDISETSKPLFFIYESKKYIEKCTLIRNLLDEPLNERRKALEFLNIFPKGKNSDEDIQLYYDQLAQKVHNFYETYDCNKFDIFPRLLEITDDFYIFELFLDDYTELTRELYIKNKEIRKVALKTMKNLEKSSPGLWPFPDFSNWVYSEREKSLKFVYIGDLLFIKKPVFYFVEDLDLLREFYSFSTTSLNLPSLSQKDQLFHLHIPFLGKIVSSLKRLL